MRSTLLAYMAIDRLHALAAGLTLPEQVVGTALFADISGFTPLTEALRQTLGQRRGAEELTHHLNRVYDALITEVERYKGSVIGFSGDAITCWFDGDASTHLAAQWACAAALAMQTAMSQFAAIQLPTNITSALTIKIAIASGSARRFVVGDSSIQLIDVLAGQPLDRMAEAETLAKSGEILIDEPTVTLLSDLALTAEQRFDSDSGNSFSLLIGLNAKVVSSGWPEIDLAALPDDVARPWLLPAVFSHIERGLGEFLTELRPVVALFLRFTGIDYETDPDASAKLDTFIRWVQATLQHHAGNLLQLTIGDKGSYLLAGFGAPIAYENDALRALNAALDLTSPPDEFGLTVQIGMSRGIARTGAYGSQIRRTYGTMGDDVNLAARLMTNAKSGTILISEVLTVTNLAGFTFESLPPMQVKGKTNPIRVLRLVGRQEYLFETRFYTTPLVGCEHELASIRQALQPIIEGQHAGVVMLYGEPGIGKSRLAFEVQNQLTQTTNVKWLTGQANALNRAPLSVFAYFLQPYFGQRRDQQRETNLAAFDRVFNQLLTLGDDAIREDLHLYRSFLAGLVGLVMPPYDTTAEKLRIENTISGIKALVRAECRHQPLVIQIEDRQWLDASSMNAVQQLTYSMENVPLLLLLTSRYNDDGTPFIIPNLYSVPTTSFDLNRLSDEGVRAVVSALLGGPASDQLAKFLYTRSEGNPFFTEQLVLDLEERNALSKVADIWDIRDDVVAEVPMGITALLIARLDRLSAQVKTVVQTAAVLGREFEIGVLSRMLREGDQVYIQAAESEAIWTALDELHYLFRHVLLRDAAYEMQAQERLKALHQLAAETIEQLYPDDETQYEALVEHWRSAGNSVKELQYLVPVVKYLGTIGSDYAHAKELAKRGLTLVAADATQRPVLLNLLTRACYESGDYTGASEWAQQAYQEAEQLENWDECVSGLNNQGMVAYYQGDPTSAQNYFQQGLDLANRIGSKSRILENLVGLGNVAARQRDFSVARAYFEEVLAAYQEQGNMSGATNLLNNLGLLAVNQKDFATADAYLRQSLSIARELGSRQAIASRLNHLGTAQAEQGNYATASDYFVQALALAREIGSIPRIASCLTNLGKLATLLANYADAHNYLQQSLTLARQIKSKPEMFVIFYSLGEIALIEGDYDQARVDYQEALSLSRELKVPVQIADCLYWLGHIAALTGTFEHGRLDLEEAISLTRTLPDPSWLGQALRYRGELGIAEAAYKQANEYLNESFEVVQKIPNRPDIGGIIGLQGWLAYYTSDYEAAKNYFQSALLEHDVASSRAGLIRVYLKLGELNLARTRLQEALVFVHTQYAPLMKIEVLIAAAELNVMTGNLDRAIEILELIIHHKATSAQLRQDARMILEGLKHNADVLEITKMVDLDMLLKDIISYSTAI